MSSPSTPDHRAYYWQRKYKCSRQTALAYVKARDLLNTPDLEKRAAAMVEFNKALKEVEKGR